MNVIVIGGGASGVMHALYLKHLNSDINVTILEQNDRILKKLLKTGNGRCNISNSLMEAKFYNNEKVISNLYNKVKPEVVINFFKSLGLLLKTIIVQDCIHIVNQQILLLIYLEMNLQHLWLMLDVLKKLLRLERINYLK